MSSTEKAAGRSEEPAKDASGSAPPTVAEPASPAGLVAFTIDAETCRLVKVEKGDSAGARHELSQQELAKLGRVGDDTLEAIVEQAFEAGIACVLGTEAREQESPETDEEARVRRLLLAPLLEASPAHRLLARESLDRAVLQTLVQHAVAARDAAKEGASPEQRTDGAPSHQRQRAPSHQPQRQHNS